MIKNSLIILAFGIFLTFPTFAPAQDDGGECRILGELPAESGCCSELVVDKKSGKCAAPEIGACIEKGRPVGQNEICCAGLFQDAGKCQTIPPSYNRCRLPGYDYGTSSNVCCGNLENINGYCSFKKESTPLCASDIDCPSGQACLQIRKEDVVDFMSSLLGIKQDEDEIESVVLGFGLPWKWYGWYGRYNDSASIYRDHGEITYWNSLCWSSHTSENMVCTEAPKDQKASVADLVSGRLTQRRICRKGDLGDKNLLDNVPCEFGLIKLDGRCVPNNSTNTSANGTNFEFKIIDSDKCQYEMNSDKYDLVRLSFMGHRAMEWLLSSSEKDTSLGYSRAEKILNLPFLFKDIGRFSKDQRVEILKSYNQELETIDKDTKTLLEANLDETKKVSINGETITSSALAARRVTGYDMSILIYRRNVLIQNYENKMSQFMTKLHERMKAYNKSIESLGSVYKDVNWMSSYAKTRKYPTYNKIRINSLGNVMVFSQTDPLIFFSFARFLKKYYWVDGNNATNQEMFKVPAIKNALSLLDPDFNKRLNIPRLNIMDPLVPGKFKFEDFGLALRRPYSHYYYGLNYPISSDYPQGRRLRGGSEKGLKEIRELFRKEVKDYLYGFNTRAQVGYIFEPELAPHKSASVCNTPPSEWEKLDSIERDICIGFQRTIDDIADTAFAYWLSYGLKEGYPNYKNYILNGKSFRRELFAHWEMEIEDIKNYYASTKNQRNTQLACLEKNIKGVIDQLWIKNETVKTAISVKTVTGQKNVEILEGENQAEEILIKEKRFNLIKERFGNKKKLQIEL